MSTTLNEIKQLVSLQLGIREINDQDHFVEQLGAESVDVMNIIVAVEDKFEIEIKESEIPHLLTAEALHNLIENHA
jgi:acyl carrier protein